MKSHYLCAAAICGAFFANGGPAAARPWQRPTATAIRIPNGAIIVDGRDDDWQRARSSLRQCHIVSSRRSLWLPADPQFGDWTGPVDSSLEAWTAVDDDSLYVLANVHDQSLINQSDEKNPFFGDDFEIFIDASPVESRFKNTAAPDYRQLIFIPGMINPHFQQTFTWHSDQVPGVQAASRLRPWGYTIEVRVPKALFPNWKAHPTLDSVGFDLQTADVDAPGIDCHHPCVKGARLGLSLGQHFRTPEKLGLLRLNAAPVRLSAPHAAPIVNFSAVDVIARLHSASPRSADAMAQEVLDRMLDPAEDRIAEAAVISGQPAIRKAGAYVFSYRPELGAPVDALKTILDPGALSVGQVPDADTRVYAMMALAERHKLLSATLLPFYVRAPAPVELAFIWCLGEDHDPAAVPGLSELLKNDKRDRVRMASALSLGILGSNLALPALHAASDDVNPYVKQQASQAIVSITLQNLTVE